MKKIYLNEVPVHLTAALVLSVSEDHYYEAAFLVMFLVAVWLQEGV